MNIFYTPPSKIQNGIAELSGQEASHASKVMRAREGDQLTIVDGLGGWYEGTIRRITKKSMLLEIELEKKVSAPKDELIIGMGIIKKRDRLEFAVEKAVELGADRICLFRSDHTIKENVRPDRLKSIAVSAMKQSLRAWLPQIAIMNSLEDVLQEYGEAVCLAAHEKVNSNGYSFKRNDYSGDSFLLLVGPEGGFSSSEINAIEEKGGELISLGPHRLRAETAVMAFLSQFIR